MATDRLRTSPLDTEHFDELTMLPERVRELMAAGHSVDVIMDRLGKVESQQYI